jgi:hypothetical protein
MIRFDFRLAGGVSGDDLFGAHLGCDSNWRRLVRHVAVAGGMILISLFKIKTWINEATITMMNWH